jgi:hypothetical protein
MLKSLLSRWLGDFKMPAALNLLHQKFGKLIVVSQLPTKNKNGAIKWKCLCECGNFTSRTGGSLLYSLKQTDSIITCGCSKKDKRSIQSYLNSKYDTYAKNAKQRNLIFALTQKTFCFLIQQNCYWCGARPKLPNKNCTYTLNIGIPIETNGIDRYDNNLGYESTNCVPCCKQCNKIKHNLSGDKFLNLINLYYHKHFLK